MLVYFWSSSFDIKIILRCCFKLRTYFWTNYEVPQFCFLEFRSCVDSILSSMCWHHWRKGIQTATWSTYYPQVFKNSTHWHGGSFHEKNIGKNFMKITILCQLTILSHWWYNNRNNFEKLDDINFITDSFSKTNCWSYLFTFFSYYNIRVWGTNVNKSSPKKRSRTTQINFFQRTSWQLAVMQIRKSLSSF